jgi:hypothetical protein
MNTKKKASTRAATPARARAAAKPAAFPLPTLKKGEAYAGVLLDAKGKPVAHLIELPETATKVTWKQALEFAMAQGGELPDRQEAALLYANRKADHENEWYWTREQHASYESYAWIQDFDDGLQYDGDKGNRYRARAVRRVPIR